MEQITQMNITWLRIPTGRRQTSWLFANVAEELSSGLPRNTKKLQETRAGLELANSAFHVRRPNHSATLPPSNDMLASFECIWHLKIHFISFSRRVSVLEPMPYMRLQVATIFVCEGYCVPA